MRVLVVYCHPVETSFHAALHQEVLRNLRAAGHEVDDCDLYAEGFDPVLSREERLGYHEVPSNQLPLKRHVERLQWAEGIVFCFPTWCFGLPAMLKGYFDRLLLPGVAFEQHGPHLPCSVDSVIASGVMGKALERLPPEVRAFALPTITYGKSEEHLHFPGTMTLTGTTLLATVTEIGESVYLSCFRKLLFANGHGGQPQVLEMAARELRLRHGDYVVVPHGVSRLPCAASKQVSDQEKRLAMHAGHSETALMLALAPDTVHMECAAANFPPPFPIKLLSPDGRPACAWTARDFGPSGVIGDPTSATREQGEEILDTLAA